MSGKNATEVLRADAAGIARAAATLERGGLVAVPTETVYGLAARADDAAAVARIYQAKGRPSVNPLIVHVRDAEQAQRYIEWTGDAERVAKSAWPGPLTLVLPIRPDARLAPAVTAGLPTLAVRAPAHPVMRALLEQVDLPLAAPSANRSEAISPTSAEHVLATLDGRIDLVLDAGPTEKGLESSILAIRHDGTWEELRAGPVDIDALHQGSSHDVDRPRPVLAGENQAATLEAPGQLARHYSPGKPLRLNADDADDDEFMIGFGEVRGDCNLSETGDLNLAASRLYACLHEAAASEKPRIAVAPIPQTGVGRAINDRLKRAAS